MPICSQAIFLSQWQLRQPERLALTFLQELGHRLQVKTGEPLLHHHLLQRIAMAMQQGNTAAVMGTMTIPTNDFDNACTYS